MSNLHNENKNYTKIVLAYSGRIRYIRIDPLVKRTLQQL